MSAADNTTLSPAQLDQLSINTIRFLSVDAVQKADSGHPGLPLGAAPMAYVLWTRFLRHNPVDPQWSDRDRFVLSAGHGSMLLYSLLHLTGYDLRLEQIKQFRQWGSMTPGHPERGMTPGVETTTGPLGQGFGNGVGMAISEAHLAARYNRPGLQIVDHFTYGLVSDGDLMEGVASEAASLAGQLELGKLIYLFDDNRVTLSAGTNIASHEDHAQRFAAYGWHTQSVEDGNDVEAIDLALRAARSETRRPSLILIRTHLGFGSPNKQDTFEAHGSPLGVEEVKLTKQNLGWPVEPLFHIPPQALAHFREALPRGQQAESEWRDRFSRYVAKYPDLAREFQERLRGELPAGWDADIPVFPADPKGMKTRVASGNVMNAIAPRLSSLMGGSADLDPSTHTALKGAGDFESSDRASGDTQGSSGGGWSYGGCNLHFGVREHGMGSILNGMAVHGGIIPYAGTFLVFADYMRPPMRLAAMMEQRVIYVFTHDSIGLGEDGTTHQPVEQLANLRAIPNLIVIRPCDANETAYAWRVAIETRDRPVALILTRQDVPILDRSRYASAAGLKRGAYILAEAGNGRPEIILIATGSEVSLIVEAQHELEKQNIQTRLVSMPSWELFDAQAEEYRRSVFPPSVRARLAVEAGATQGWHRYVGDLGDVIGLDHFGASAPAPVLMREYGFTVENVCKRARALLGGRIMSSNPLKRLEALGQSIWLDYIRRDLIVGGELRRLIDEDGLRGMTSNPSIFEKAITGSHDYDEDIRTLALEGKGAPAVFEALTVRDVQSAADQFRPLYDKIDGQDGYVSLEVNPHLAHDTKGTINEARRLWDTLSRPNVFVKVPATAAGVPAIQQLIGQGVSVNVTLLFGLPRYRQVAEAYIAGIEARAAQGKAVKHVASVASFFVSRIDTLVDPLLEKIIAQGGTKAEIAKKVRGLVAISSAKVAYQIYKEIFGSDRFRKLAAQGARVQRLLWASTGTKNPDYSDVKYIDGLIGPDTINTIPLETLAAYRDHGDPKIRLEEGVREARWVLEQLPELGISIDEVTQQLEDEGVEKFNQPFDKLMQSLAQKSPRI